MKIHPVAKIVAGLLAVNGGVQAADVTRSSANGPLNLTTAWNGGVVPGSGDTAVWDSSANAGTTTLGADLAWQGIRVLDPSLISVGGSNVLTLGAGGIDMSAATVDAILSFNYSLAASQTWQVASGRTLNINNAAISGGNTELLTLSGPGTITFTSATDQTYSGGTLLQNGVTVLMGNNNGGGNFGTGKVSIQGNGVTIAGHTSGIRTLNTQVEFLGSANTVTFGTTGQPSQMIMTAGASLGSAKRTISLVNPNAPTTSNIGLTLAGSVTSSAGGSLVLANGNATPASQEVWVKFGASANPALINGEVEIGQHVQAYLNSSNELGANAIVTVNGVLDVSAKTTGTVQATIKSLSGTGRVYSGRTNTSANTLIIDGGVSTGTTTFSGTLENGATSPLAITKAGNSTQILSGNNTYTGVTTVNAGTLLINGNQSAASGNVTVALGAILGGTGTIGGTTTVNGTLAPGTSPGTLTFSQGLNINNGSTYAFEGGDLVVVNGQLDLNDNWTLALGSGFADGGSVVIFDYGTLAATPDLTPTFDISGLGFTPSGPLTLVNDTVNGTIVLQGVSVIPEPSAVLLTGIGLSVALFGARRRLKA